MLFPSLQEEAWGLGRVCNMSWSEGRKARFKESGWRFHVGHVKTLPLFEFPAPPHHSWNLRFRFCSEAVPVPSQGSESHWECWASEGSVTTSLPSHLSDKHDFQTLNEKNLMLPEEQTDLPAYSKFQENFLTIFKSSAKSRVWNTQLKHISTLVTALLAALPGPGVLWQAWDDFIQHFQLPIYLWILSGEFWKDVYLDKLFVSPFAGNQKNQGEIRPLVTSWLLFWSTPR